jgi:hypothetical protein
MDRTNWKTDTPLTRVDSPNVHDRKFFTLVFEGNLAAFDGNPFRTETPFGVPFAAGYGNALEQVDQLEGHTRDDIESPHPDGRR